MHTSYENRILTFWRFLGQHYPASQPMLSISFLFLYVHCHLHRFIVLFAEILKKNLPIQEIWFPTPKLYVAFFSYKAISSTFYVASLLYNQKMYLSIWILSVFWLINANFKKFMFLPSHSSPPTKKNKNSYFSRQFTKESKNTQIPFQKSQKSVAILHNLLVDMTKQDKYWTNTLPPWYSWDIQQKPRGMGSNSILSLGDTCGKSHQAVGCKSVVDGDTCILHPVVVHGSLFFSHLVYIPVLFFTFGHSFYLKPTRLEILMTRDCIGSHVPKWLIDTDNKCITFGRKYLEVQIQSFWFCLKIKHFYL